MLLVKCKKALDVVQLIKRSGTPFFRSGTRPITVTVQSLSNPVQFHYQTIQLIQWCTDSIRFIHQYPSLNDHSVVVHCKYFLVEG